MRRGSVPHPKAQLTDAALGPTLVFSQRSVDSVAGPLRLYE